MVRNYKWNISLEKGKLSAHETIIEIIKEHNDLIDLNKLILLLNQRTKHLNLKNNNVKRTITNFLKSTSCNICVIKNILYIPHSVSCF